MRRIRASATVRIPSDIRRIPSRNRPIPPKAPSIRLRGIMMLRLLRQILKGNRNGADSSGLPENSFLQFLTHLEKRKFFGSDRYGFTRFRVSSGIGLVILDNKTSQATNFYPVALRKSLGH